MAIRSLSYLKSKFETNDIPTADDFIDLIDTLHDIIGTEVTTAPQINAGVLSIDCAAGTVFTINLNQDISSLNLINPPAAGGSQGITVAFTADGIARTIAWPASFRWANGIEPTPTITMGKVDIFIFVTWDMGTTWYAHVAGQNM